MASQLLGIKTRFTNDLGSPLVGGQVYTYFAGTSTNQDSYSDAALTIPNTNPVILDDTGSADIFLKGSYRIRVFDVSGRFIEEQDNVTQAVSKIDVDAQISDVNAVAQEAKERTETKSFDLAVNKKAPKPLEFFNTNTIKVGTFNADVDSAALQAAVDSEYAVDLAGLKLKINKTINISKNESYILSSLPYQRNGSGDAVRSANIDVVDDSLPVLFNVTGYNSRFSGIRIRCNTTNSTTEIIKAQRADYTRSDVDILINDMTFEYGLRFVNVRGRGLDFQRCAIVGSKDMAIRLDWDSRWTPNGQSNDENGTAQRAYTISDIRQHGCLGLIDNIGDYRQQVGNILISNIQGDTGGCLFKGVMSNVVMTNAHSYLHPVSQQQFDIWDGSHDSFVIGFNCAGYFDANVSRMPSQTILLKPDILGIRNLIFSNGVIGATSKTPIYVIGGGVLDITFDNVSFNDCARTTNEIMYFKQDTGKTITAWDINLKNCRFRKSDDIGANQIMNGTNSDKITIYRDFMTRKLGYTTWANPSFTEVSEMVYDPSTA